MSTDHSHKRADTDHPVHDLIATRFSPYLYEPRDVESAKLLSCLEAARWAASSFNEQPWSLIVATRDNEAAFEGMLGCLMEANQAWASQCGALILTVVSRTFSRNGKPNRTAEHDMGLAMGNLTLQATHEGLAVHQMAGINPAVARQSFGIPEGFDPYTAIAIGYAADATSIDSDDPLVDRDNAPRIRKPLSEFVFANAWGVTAELG